MSKKELTSADLKNIVGGNVCVDVNGIYRDIPVEEKDLKHTFPIGLKCKVYDNNVLKDVTICQLTKTPVANFSKNGKPLYIASYVGLVDNLPAVVVKPLTFTEADIFNNNHNL